MICAFSLVHTSQRGQVKRHKATQREYPDGVTVVSATSVSGHIRTGVCTLSAVVRVGFGNVLREEETVDASERRALMDAATAEVEDLVSRWPELSGVRLTWSERMTRLLGCANYSPFEIRLSASQYRRAVEEHGVEVAQTEMVDTIRHEAAHLVVYRQRGNSRPHGAPHGRQWQNTAMAMGARPSRFGSPEVWSHGSSVSEWAVGQAVRFEDRGGQEWAGQIVSMGPKRAKVRVDGSGDWHVPYVHLAAEADTMTVELEPVDVTALLSDTMASIMAKYR